MKPVLLSSIKKGAKFKLSPTSEYVYTLVDYNFEVGLMECICDNFDYDDTYIDENNGQEITIPAWPDSVTYSYFQPFRLVFPL